MLTSLDSIDNLQEIFDADFTELLKQKQLSYDPKSSQFIAIGNFIAAYNKYLDDIFYGRITDKDMAISSYNFFVRDFNTFLESNEQDIEDPELEEADIKVAPGDDIKNFVAKKEGWKGNIFKDEIDISGPFVFMNSMNEKNESEESQELPKLAQDVTEADISKLSWKPPKLPQDATEADISKLSWMVLDKLLTEGKVADQVDINNFVDTLAKTGATSEQFASQIKADIEQETVSSDSFTIEPAKYSATIDQYIAENETSEHNVLTFEQKNAICREIIQASIFLKNYLSKLPEAQLEETVARFIENVNSDLVDDFDNMPAAFMTCAEHIRLSLAPNGQNINHIKTRAVQELAFHLVFQFSAASKVVHQASDEDVSNLGGEDADDS